MSKYQEYELRKKMIVAKDYVDYENQVKALVKELKI